MKNVIYLFNRRKGKLEEKGKTKNVFHYQKTDILPGQDIKQNVNSNVYHCGNSAFKVFYEQFVEFEC